jgi:YfiH family protein
VDLPEPFYWRDGHIAIDLPGAGALFTTRHGGHSTGPYAGLNLGLLTDDDTDTVRANRALISTELNVQLAWRKQVHGNKAHVVDAPTDADATPVDGDAVVTSTPGIGTLILAADCLPIVVTDGTTVASIHAGWPGLDKGIIGAGVASIVAATSLAMGAVGAEDNERTPRVLTAAIGPHAGACCYEVGDELHERFAPYGVSVGRNLDLGAIARRQLERTGVQAVYDVGVCTICSDPALLYSHRRDKGVTGRQAGIGWLKS